MDEAMSRGLPVVECLHKDEAFFLSECEHPACFVGGISTSRGGHAFQLQVLS